MILSFTWLDKHNPEINFRTQSIKMTRCLPRCCIGCQTERKGERNAKEEDAARINTCQMGPFPAFVEDADEEEDELKEEPEHLSDVEPDDSNELLDEGDRIWATGLLPRAGYI